MSRSGLIQAIAAPMQNNCTTSYRVVLTLADTNKVDIALLTLSGVLKANTVDIIHWEMIGATATGVMLTGSGTFGLSGKPGTPGRYWIHAYKDKTGNWLQAEIWNMEHTALLWATGAVWPAESSTAVKCPALQLIPPK